MDFHCKDLITERDRWLKILSSENEHLNICKINITDVIDAHFSIVDYFLESGKEEKAVGGIGPRDEGLLSSAVVRQITSFGGQEKWKTDFEKCATLFYGIIKNHSFHDCNKRTALLIALYYLSKMNRTPKVKQKELEKLTVRVANNELHKYKKRYKPFRKMEDGDIYFLARYFQKNTRIINKRHYVITYHQLNSILLRFGFCLENPQKHHIDIIKIKEKKSIWRKKATEKIKIGRISFPGWTREICQKDINYVRSCTKLLPKNYFDSEVFFREAEPLKSLINEFRGPLKRLANK